MTLWSVVAICQCRLTGVKTFYATRSLLGLLEGGFIPDVVLYLSFFYTSKELPIRLSFFWSAYISTQIVSALLAYGILHLRSVTGWAGWRWLFALEGGLTLLIGVFSWFYLPPSPTETKGYLRGKNGWFTEHEEKIMVNRILRDDPAKGGMHNRQGLTLGLLWEALKDYDMWPLYLLGLTWSIPATPITAYLTLNLKELGFSTFQTNLLTIPAYVLFLIQLLWWTWVSEKWNNRMMIVIISQAWCFPLILALELLPNSASPWAWYACSALLVGYPYIHAILGAYPNFFPLFFFFFFIIFLNKYVTKEHSPLTQELPRNIVALTSRNAGSVRTRTVGSALYNMCVQASNIIATNIYRTEDQPYYRVGNKVIIGIICWSTALIIFIKFYYLWRNKKRDQAWGVMTPGQRDEYLRSTKDEGNKRLDFRFAH